MTGSVFGYLGSCVIALPVIVFAEVYFPPSHIHLTKTKQNKVKTAKARQNTTNKTNILPILMTSVVWVPWLRAQLPVEAGIPVNGWWQSVSLRGLGNDQFLSRLLTLATPRRCSVSAEQSAPCGFPLRCNWNWKTPGRERGQKLAGKWALERASTTAPGITSMCQTTKILPVRLSTRRAYSEWDTGSAVKLVVAVKFGVLYLVSFNSRGDF